MIVQLMSMALAVSVASHGAHAIDPSSQSSEDVVTEGGVEGVAVRVDPGVPDAELTQEWVEERVAKVLSGSEGGASSGGLVRVTVSGSPYDYRIAIALLQDESALPAELQPEDVLCECGTDEMLDEVARGVEAGARTLDELEARRHGARVEPVAPEPPSAPTTSLQDELDGPPKELPDARRWGVASIAIGGAVALGGGIVSTQENGGGDPLGASRTSKVGHTVLGLGVAAMVGGASVLVVDAIRCRRGRGRCAPGRGRHARSILPWLRPHGVGS